MKEVIFFAVLVVIVLLIGAWLIQLEKSEQNADILGYLASTDHPAECPAGTVTAQDCVLRFLLSGGDEER